MIFEVERTSDWGDNNKPCDEAIVIDTIVDSFNNKLNVYGIEIKDFDDLNKFIKKYGHIIISNYHSTNKTTMSIEIYDDYRE